MRPRLRRSDGSLAAVRSFRDARSIPLTPSYAVFRIANVIAPPRNTGSSQRRSLLGRLGGLLLIIGLAGFVARAGAQTIVNSGTGQIQGTWLFDFDLGVQTAGAGADVWWEQQTSIIRNMTRSGTAQLANLGVINFSTVSYNMLTGTTYSTTPIVGNDDGTNQLVTGDVFAVLTGSGNYAKVLVTNYGYNLQIQWVTYSTTPIPEPASLGALLAVGAMAVAVRRRRGAKNQFRGER